MVKAVYIYVEGGGNKSGRKNELREGFNKFLGSLMALARERRIRLRPVPCGSRESTFDNFRTAQRTHKDSFNALLVDSDGAVNSTPLQHLRSIRSNLDLAGASEDQCHLMVQMMEAWLVADIEALRKHYGAGFNERAIPRTHNVEDIDKDRLKPALKSATRQTQKGEYHELTHGARLLAVVDAAKVRQRALHCDRLFKVLEERITSPLSYD